MTMIRKLALSLALALASSPLFALSNSFSYQGSLSDGGTPANGSFDLQFQLQTSAGTNVGAPLLRDDVPVSGGVFSVELDFGSAITSADFRLQVSVRPGASTGAFTTLSPATNIRPAPQAQVAGIASEAVTVSPNAITSTSISDGSVTIADINPNFVQARVDGTCPAGSSIRVINSNGTVTCETDDGGAGGGGTVTSVASGAGLTGGPITTSGSLSIATGGVTSAMIADSSIANADLALNSVTTGNILDSTVGSADINSSQVQTRVTGSCAADSSISAIAANGTVTCEPDDIGAPGWSLSGNTGTDPSTQFIGTTDNQALVLRVNNARAMRIEPNSTSPNLISGFNGNEVTTGIYGATIGGGGTSGNRNRVTDDLGTVAGGAGNTASGSISTVSGGAFNVASGERSTAAGGSSNSASGKHGVVGGGFSNTGSGAFSAVSGGSTNTASGQNSTIGGGNLNCAGGELSWAGGQQAKVRPGSESGVAGNGCLGIEAVGLRGDRGTFVWADSQGGDFVSSGTNQFLVRAGGGVGINGTPATAGLEFNVFGTSLFDGFVEFSLIPMPALNGNTGERVEFGVGKGGVGSNDADLRIAHRNDSGGFFEHLSIDGDGSVIVRSNPNNLAQGVQLAIGAGAWSSLSDRNLKTDIQAIQPMQLLERLVAMPIQQWRYIGQPGEVLHIGPMAQDFAAAFGVGENDTTISTIDADGVALAAIQGLNQKLETERDGLRAENAELRKRLSALEAHLGLRSQ